MRHPTLRIAPIVGGASLLLLALGAAGCGDSSSPDGETPASTPSAPAARDAQVEVRQFQFMPGTLDIEAGTTVTWTNRDDIEHTVTSGEPGSPTSSFDGVLNGAGTTYTFTASEQGDYAYFCERHQSMRGVIHVS